MNGKRFGPTLGRAESEAVIELRRMLAEIDDCRFQRPSAKKNAQIKLSAPDRLSFAELCDLYLTETVKRNGHNTRDDYLARLMHAVGFAESEKARREWPYAGNLNRSFAIALKNHLHSVQTTRNGKPGAKSKSMSPRQILNVMEAVRGALHWANRPDVRLVPFDFINPFTKEVVGEKEAKDPLRKQKLPLDRRVVLVKHLDCWQLATIGLLAVLPFRPEELQGILIGDVDFEARTISVGTRFEGADFTKSRQQYVMPLPQDLMPILRKCIGERREGPLLLRRTIWAFRKCPKTFLSEPGDIEEVLQIRLREAGDRVQTAQDRKRVFRDLVRDVGGLDTGGLGKEMRSRVGESLGLTAQLYDMRKGVSTDMAAAGVNLLVLRYLTSHATNDIMNEYVSLDPQTEMEKYFVYAKPLLEAIRHRGEELGCVAS